MAGKIYRTFIKRTGICGAINMGLLFLFVLFYKEGIEGQAVGNFYELLSLGIMQLAYMACLNAVLRWFNLYTMLRYGDRDKVIMKASRTILFATMVFVAVHFLPYAIYVLWQQTVGVTDCLLLFAEKTVVFYLLGELSLVCYLRWLRLTEQAVALCALYVSAGWIWRRLFDIYAFDIPLLPMETGVLLVLIIVLQLYLVNGRKGDLIWERN